MSTITINAETELELQRIVAALRESGIPFTVKKLSDTVFPSIDQMNPYAIISVPEDYEKELGKILNSERDLKAAPKEAQRAGTKGKTKFGFIFLISYSALATVLLLKYWYIHRNSLEDKNYVYEWSMDNTSLNAKSKKTGTDAYRYFDANYNFNFEEMYFYSSTGNRLMTGYDINEDGLYEETYVFNMAGELTSTQVDSNHDGVIDKLELVLENRDTLKFVDTNYNGFLEVMKIN